MRDDLLDAQASVDWAVSQLPSFVQRIEAWLRDNVYFRVEKTEPPITHSVLIASQKDRFPLTFNVEFGAYINAIRSSLDILATALAIRRGACRPDKAYFPVARSAAAFAAGSYKGHELVKGLPDTERVVIESLKPYKGGNETLCTLHDLDIVRKHRRLIDVQASPASMTIKGSDAALRQVIPTGFGTVRPNEETILCFLWNRAANYNIKVAPHVAINEVGSAGRKPVIADLNEFASLAHAIIKLIDTP